MGALIVQQLPVDSIIGSASLLIEDMELQMGNLMEQCQPVAMVIYDLLKRIGLPDNAIGIAMGGYYDLIADEHDKYAPPPNQVNAICIYCGDTAVQLCPTPAGEKMVCVEHMHRLADLLFGNTRVQPNEQRVG